MGQFVSCHFQRNRTAGDGGTVSAQFSAELTFRSCTFFANTADRACGAVDVASVSPLVVERCLFIENEGWRPEGCAPPAARSSSRATPSSAT
ncbi:MAG: hypothetical protein R3D98_16310 [Candidatus Krumholzibacteriia bacterium]